MTKRGTTMGSDPLDGVIPRQDGIADRQDRQTPALASQTRVVKERLTVHIPVDLIDRVKNTVYWTPGLTLARLAEEALAKRVEEMEKARGDTFPPRQEELRGGRPLK